MPRARKSPYTLADFEKFCRTLVLDTGKFMKLEAHERQIAKSHFDGADELVIIIPKKNGKTTLLAALALYHLARIPDADCIIVAASRDQATILYKQAGGFVRRTPGLLYDGQHPKGLFKVQPGYRRIVGMNGVTGMIRALASDIDTLDGEIPTLALVDELHRHKKDETYSVLRLSLGGRSGKMLTISTAGATMGSPLGTIRTTAHAMPSFTRDEDRRYNHAVDDQGSFVFHEWCLSNEDDPEDMETVKLANPASWRTVEVLSKERNSPGVTPWSWLRFACGVWTEGQEPWIEPAKWDMLADDELEIDDDSTIYVGVDVGARRKSIAVVAVRVVDDQLWVKAYIGADSSVADAEAKVRELAERYKIEAVVYDRQSFERSADLLENEGIDVLMFPHSPERMELASATLYKVVDDGRLRHDGDLEFRAQVLAGRVKESERGWRFIKDPTLPRPIEALIALAVAVHIAESQPPQQFAVAFT